ncbi:MAG: DUF1553 domain-containing protein [Acidobacteria bacterium]|nr:DUF1553 domain-containing protein [Acidobacteriota bacterium]
MRLLTALISLAALPLAGLAAALDPPQRIEFNRDVRPILSDRCFACHGPDAENRKTPLRLDTAEGAAVDLNSGGRALTPGDPSTSKLIERVRSDSPVLRMPPAYAGHDALTEPEIRVLERWIEQGAAFESHWAFRSPTRPHTPVVRRQDWVRNPIDAFVLARLEQEGLSPSREADKAKLLRRVSLDLTGLPASPVELDRFLSDRSPDAYEKAVRRLLDSPRYGERMALLWLDAARYADTNGYQSDGSRSMWRWRDWVIASFNQNMPFDEFTVEQIAGDLLPGATRDQILATGFLRNHRTNAEGGIVEEEFMVEYAADRAETTATVWMGLTVGCARCHDHKFDPIKQKEFYQLFAYFNNLDERGLVYNFGNDGPQIKAPTREQDAKLEILRAAAAEADSKWDALAGPIRAARKSWESGLAPDAHADFPSRNLLARFPLDDALEATALVGVDDDKRNLQPKPSEPAFSDGLFARAGAFDGERYLDAGGIAGFQYDDPFTVSLWLKPEAADGGVISRMQDHDTGSGWGLLLREGRLRFEFTMRHTDHSLRVETQRALPLDEWSHVAIVFGGELPSHRSLRLVVNGESWPFEVEWDDLKWPIGYANYPLRIGAAAGRRFQGLIDEVRMYGRALDEAEVAALGVSTPVGVLAARARRTEAEEARLQLAFLEAAAPREIRTALEAKREAERRAERFEKSLPTVMVMREMDQPRQAHVLRRGAYDAPGDPVSPGVPSFLPPLPADAPANRLGLARWLVAPENPLTARVAVNRFWQMLFGRGLVATAEDFGSQGQWPSHPELLDWLAVEFVQSGWDVKHLLELMVTSAAYRQDSAVTPQLLERDPENRLLARGPRLRLDAAAIRDQALWLAGELQQEIGGPPVKPYQPKGLWEEVSGRSYVLDEGGDLYRRSLYTYWKRTVAPPAMIAFDASDRESCSVKPKRTNTPLQALNLMNDETYLEAARHLAERSLRDGGLTPEDRLSWAFRLATARPPTASESKALVGLQARLLADYRKNPDAAYDYLEPGESGWDSGFDAAELASYAGAASLILNLDEVITKE